MEPMGGQSQTQSQSQSQSHSSVQSNLRTKTDKTWDYATQIIKENGKAGTICNFCQKIMGGGGINRVKLHLAGEKGQVAPCMKVTPEVRFTMQGILKEIRESGNDGISIPDDETPETQSIKAQSVKAQSVIAGKRKATSSLHPFFTKGINDPSQSTIKSAMQSKE